MEFKLNKIDSTLRQKVNDQTKAGMVHATNEIQIKKDKKENKNKNNGNLKRKKIVITVVKDHGDKSISKDKHEGNNKGVYLDIKK